MCKRPNSTKVFTTRQAVNEPAHTGIVNTTPRSWTARHRGHPSVHDPVESCSRCRGIRVHHPLEIVFTIAWNTHKGCRGYTATPA